MRREEDSEFSLFRSYWQKTEKNLLVKWEENQASVVSQNSKEDGILKREESILRLQLS